MGQTVWYKYYYDRYNIRNDKRISYLNIGVAKGRITEEEKLKIIDNITL